MNKTDYFFIFIGITILYVYYRHFAYSYHDSLLMIHFALYEFTGKIILSTYAFYPVAFKVKSHRYKSTRVRVLFCAVRRKIAHAAD